MRIKRHMLSHLDLDRWWSGEGWLERKVVGMKNGDERRQTSSSSGIAKRDRSCDQKVPVVEEDWEAAKRVLDQ